MAPSRYDITLHLDNLARFFAVPEPDPIDPQVRFASGLETISSELKPKALIRKVRTTLVLPPAQIAPDAEARLRAALTRYCQHHIAQNRQDLISLRWQGIKALQNGFIFLATCLRRFGGEGFLIAVWVSPWHPIEILLYECDFSRHRYFDDRTSRLSFHE